MYNWLSVVAQVVREDTKKEERQMVNLEDVKQKITYKTVDFESPLSASYFTYDANLGSYGGLVSQKQSENKYLFTQIGFESLCRLIKGQSRFLLSLKPEVRTKVINTKLDELVDKPVWIRCIKEDEQLHIRAIIGRNWTPFDNNEVIDELEYIMQDYNMSVSSVDFVDYKMDIRCIFDDAIGLDDDQVNVGLSIINDECMSKPLTMDLFLFRQVCSNGMIVKFDSQNISSIPHASISSERFRSALSMVLTAIHPNIRFLVNAFYSIKDKKLDSNTIDNMVYKWQKFYRIPKKMIKESIKANPTTYYDFINGITEAARDTDAMNSRRGGEISAGNMMLDLLSGAADVDMKQFDNIFIKKGRGRPRKDEL